MKTSLPQKKILHVIDSFGSGGAETWLLACVKYLHKHPDLNHRFDFLATSARKGIFDDEIIKYGCSIYYIKYSLIDFFIFRKHFKALLKSKHYDAIHNHQDFIAGWHYLAGYGALPNTLITHLHNPYNFVHNYVTTPLRWISFKLGRLLNICFTTKITGTSNAVMDEYGYQNWPFRKKRVAPAYCGFNVENFKFNKSSKSIICQELGWNIDNKIALFVGRIGLHEYDTAKNQKNPLFAFAIARALVEKNKSWKFLFVGFKGKLGEHLEQQVIDTQLQDSIKFLGLRNDIPDLMSSVDILVFPSFWEGLGMVAVEAQATGLPVLASDTLPNEAFLIDSLTFKKSLDHDNIEHWLNTLQKIGNQNFTDREQYNDIMKKSPFNIENSVAYLMELYN